MLMGTTMEIRPIRTDKDHRAALAEIDKLWGASSGTPDGDKLDILVTLVETAEGASVGGCHDPPIAAYRTFKLARAGSLHDAIEDACVAIRSIVGCTAARFSGDCAAHRPARHQTGVTLRPPL
jgi:hypothetical protein